MAKPQQASNALHYSGPLEVGVVAVIAPWNTHLHLLTFKAGTGNGLRQHCCGMSSELTYITA
ncbi:hypothetical protein HPB48_013830 [Haemaphysalis longicornis]|uniref:Uncharacterized protein n=1 Tax=Haemaphysalis longicornis TaxID=44386 RepID=A0A9J6GIB2_HAELO|nr:hypothetical protein HPB48_013830 [Haemaphysalis longicornis]